MPRPHVSDVALDLSVNSSRKSPTERNAQRMPDQYCFYNAPTSSQSLQRFNARIRSLYAVEVSESAYLPKTDSHYVSLPLRTFRLESGDDDPQLRNILKGIKTFFLFTCFYFNVFVQNSINKNYVLHFKKFIQL
jgi:hypothetical protein